MTRIHKKLIAIKDSESYELLEPFKKKKVWATLGDEEKDLLARLLIKHGELQLARGDRQVLENFEAAAQVSSYSSDILVRQGKILGSYPDNMRCLKLACEAFSRAIAQDSGIFEALYRRAECLIHMGLFENEASYFIDASGDFEHAEALLHSAPENNVGDFYQKWGKCLASLGKLSGEPSDFRHAIEKYDLVGGACNEPDFFIEYGDCFVDLASLLNKADYYRNAMQLFDQAILSAPDRFDAFYRRAYCLHRLYVVELTDSLFEAARQSFAVALELNPEHPEAWLTWGQSDLCSGKVKKDPALLHSALEKFEKCRLLDPELPGLLCAWADAELFLGAFEERLELIYSAQEKVSRSLTTFPEDPEGWFLYGEILIELGRYFADARFFSDAVKKFEYGLTLSQQNAKLWYGLGSANFFWGELTEQRHLFEAAVKCYSKVWECGETSAQFWSDWGLALMRLGEISNQASFIEMAIDKFEKSLNEPVNRAEEDGIDLDRLCHYGCAFDLLGDLTDEPLHFEKAVQILTQVLQFDTDYREARYNLALSLSHLAESMYDSEPYVSAIEHFQYLLDEDPEDEVIHLDFGMTLIGRGLMIRDPHQPEPSEILYRRAENHLMQAAALGNAQSFYQLAGLYSITGQFDQSMHFLERAHRADVLPAIEDLLHDEWLEGVSYTPSFRHFINELSRQ